jgi:hypothetical protein
MISIALFESVGGADIEGRSLEMENTEVCMEMLDQQLFPKALKLLSDPNFWIGDMPGNRTPDHIDCKTQLLSI